MDGFGVGDVRTRARSAWLFGRIVTTGSVVLSEIGGGEAGTAAAHRYLTSPCTNLRSILRALGARPARARAGRLIVAVQDTSAINLARRGPPRARSVRRRAQSGFLPAPPAGALYGRHRITFVHAVAARGGESAVLHSLAAGPDMWIRQVYGPGTRWCGLILSRSRPLVHA